MGLEQLYAAVTSAADVFPPPAATAAVAVQAAAAAAAAALCESPSVGSCLQPGSWRYYPQVDRWLAQGLLM